MDQTRQSLLLRAQTGDARAWKDVTALYRPLLIGWLRYQAVPVSEQVTGRGFIVENYDPISALAQVRSGRLTPLAWLSSLRTIDETAWFARDDLRPFGLMCLRMGWRMATRPFAGNRRHDPSPHLRYRAGRAASGTDRATNARPGAPRPAKEETPA